MKRKTNKTKSIIGFTMGAIVALGALPFSSMQGIFKANAEATKPTYTETKVDLPNSSFETLVDGNFSIGDWTVDYSSKDEGENEQNSTTMSGALNTTFENYATNYTTQFKNMWLESFSANFATLPHLQAVKAALENELGHLQIQ